MVPTKQELINLTNNNLPDNTTQLINPFRIREVFLNFIESLFGNVHTQNTDTGTNQHVFTLGNASTTEAHRTLAAEGSAANIDLVLLPKGAGATRIPMLAGAAVAPDVPHLVEVLIPARVLIRARRSLVLRGQFIDGLNVHGAHFMFDLAGFGLCDSRNGFSQTLRMLMLDVARLGKANQHFQQFLIDIMQSAQFVGGSQYLAALIFRECVHSTD